MPRIALPALMLSASLVPTVGRADVILGTPSAGGYTFINFDPSVATAGTSSNVNGLSNTGQVVGATVTTPIANFAGVPGHTTALNVPGTQTAFGINSAGDVVGGNNTTAFFLPKGGSLQTLTTPVGAINAFGINDHGNIVGQYTTVSGTTPGFILPGSGSSSFTTINAPSGPNTVNAQGINNNGLVVGFYLGTDGQVHGFRAQAPSTPSTITGTAIADPVIPPVAGEPGATFVFSQLLGVNDHGIVSGYYGDSTLSQHGFLYNTNTGTYTFLDDPAAAFFNGVEVTQITGINNVGELAGFYTDASGVAHGFVACPTGVTCPFSAVPEPSSLLLAGFGCGVLGLIGLRRRRPIVSTALAQR